MTVGRPPDNQNEAFWRDYLTSYDALHARGRRIFNALPHGPRCQLCAAPFGGVGGSVMRLIGRRPSDANPKMCNSCQKYLIRYHGGAEVDGTMLFADIRGSTAMAERMSASEFHALLERFYAVASGVVYDHDGMVDKFVGDELVAIFPPMMSTVPHAARAVAAAEALLRAVGHGGPGEPWVPVGAGVHTGLAWFGAVGEGTHVELTILGDVVNTTARLAAAAEAGEILVSAAAAEAAGLDAGLARAELELKGKAEATEVVRVRVDAREVGAGR